MDTPNNKVTETGQGSIQTDPHGKHTNLNTIPPHNQPEHHAARKGHHSQPGKDEYKTITPGELRHTPNPDELING